MTWNVIQKLQTHWNHLSRMQRQRNTGRQLPPRNILPKLRTNNTRHTIIPHQSYSNRRTQSQPTIKRILAKNIQRKTLTWRRIKKSIVFHKNLFSSVQFTSVIKVFSSNFKSLETFILLHKIQLCRLKGKNSTEQ